LALALAFVVALVFAWSTRQYSPRTSISRSKYNEALRDWTARCFKKKGFLTPQEREAFLTDFGFTQEEWAAASEAYGMPENMARQMIQCFNERRPR
jgi:hypothetical protein